MTDPWLTDQEQEAWRTWLKVSADVHAALAKDLQASSELSYPDFAVLVQLTDDPHGRVRVTDLAAGLQWDRSRVSHHLKRMESRGLISRSDCPEDGRVAYLSITSAGRAAIEQAAPRHAELVKRVMFSHLSAADLAVFADVNRAIAAQVKELS